MRRLVALIIVPATMSLCSAANTEPAYSTDPTYSSRGVDMTADEVFSHIRDVATTETCPIAVKYNIVVQASLSGLLRRNTYGASYDASIGRVSANRFSNEQAESPTVPHGTNVVITLLAGSGGATQQSQVSGLSKAITAKLNHDGPPADLIGTPMLDPFYTFGVRRDTNEATNAHLQHDPRYTTIATISSLKRTYVVSLVDEDDSKRGDVFHLTLVPVREPRTFRLREIWASRRTFQLIETRTSGNFAAGPTTQTDWSTKFDTLKFPGCATISTEAANGELDFGTGQHYKDLTVSFDDVRVASTTIPDFEFKKPERSSDVIEPPGSL